MRETWVPSLGWEEPLEKGLSTHSGILAWRIPWTVIVHGVPKSQTQLSDVHFHFEGLSALAAFLAANHPQQAQFRLRVMCRVKVG